jgi:hypothetical protein
MIHGRSINKLIRIIDVTNKEDHYIQIKFSNYNLIDLETRNYFL